MDSILAHVQEALECYASVVRLALRCTVGRATAAFWTPGCTVYVLLPDISTEFKKKNLIWTVTFDMSSLSIKYKANIHNN